MALDRCPETGEVRSVEVTSTLPGELLETGILVDDRSDAEVRDAITPIVEELYTNEFLTPFGLRARGLRHRPALEPDALVAYQGSLVTWPVMTNIVSRGLRRCGLPGLAADLEDRIEAGIRHYGDFTEGWIVDQDGAIEPGIHEDGLRHPERPVATGIQFESAQAWTISAAVRACLIDRDSVAPTSEGWRRDLERACMDRAASVDSSSAPRVRFLRDPDAAKHVERAILAST
jgi:glycogen debranching enzyme